MTELKITKKLKKSKKKRIIFSLVFILFVSGGVYFALQINRACFQPSQSDTPPSRNKFKTRGLSGSPAQTRPIDLKNPLSGQGVVFIKPDQHPADTPPPGGTVRQYGSEMVSNGTRYRTVKYTFPGNSDELVKFYVSTFQGRGYKILRKNLRESGKISLGFVKFPYEIRMEILPSDARKGKMSGCDYVIIASHPESCEKRGK